MAVIIRLETGEVHVVNQGSRSVIGRDPHVEVPIRHPRISREHAEVKWVKSQWLFVDRKSANGSFEGEKAISELPLTGEHEIRLGGESGPGLWLTVLPETTDTDTDTDPPPGIRKGDTHIPSGHIPLPPRLRLGAHRDNDVVIVAEDVADFEATISQTPRGRHELVLTADASSASVNSESPSRRHPLAPGDTVSIGPWSMRYTGNALEPLDATGGYSFTVDGVTVIAGEKTLLDDVSFQLKPRTVTAVVGPSGAGKSTLLNAMTGRKPATYGNVWVGDFDLYERYDELRTRLGLVPQSDLLHLTLRTRQALEYAAALRFPRGTNPEMRSQRVQDVMEILGLTNQADLPINNLSGGQRKRASVALELLTEPDLLFLDEPTSGLDPGLDRQVMKQLRELANGGRTVVVVTHSVANLDVCDEVIVLAPGGRVAYQGSPFNVLAHFGASDWAEVFDALHTGSAPPPTGGRTHYGIDPERGKKSAIPAHTPPGWWSQFLVQAQRYFSVIASDRYFLALIGVLPFVLAGVGSAVGTEYGLGEGPDDMGGINMQARSLLLVIVLGASFMGLSGSIQELVKERTIYERERSIGLNSSAYLASKIAVLGLIISLQIAVFISVTLGGRAVPEEGLILSSAFAELLMIGIVLGWASMIVGMLISSLVNSSEVTMPALVLTTMIQVVLSGAVPIRYTEVLDVVGTVNPGYWAMSWLGALTDLNSLAGLESDDKGTFWDATTANAETSFLFLASLALVALVATRVSLHLRERQ